MQCSGRGDVGARELAREMLHFVGLEKRRHEFPGGLTLVRAQAAGDGPRPRRAPKALLLDEVIAGVNPREAREMVTLIRRVRDERGVSILMIEHVMAAVMSLCERVVVLDCGKLIAGGAPKEIVAGPAGDRGLPGEEACLR